MDGIKLKNKNKTYEIAMIAMSVAMLIGGGIGIYAISAVFPVPGSKYVMMAPVIATILYVMQIKLKGQTTILKFGGVFALVMTLVNLFMGIAILLTTFCTHVSVLWIKNNERKAYWGSVLYAGYTGVIALSITKLFISGIVDEIPYIVFVGIGALCMIFGIIGTTVAKRIIKSIKGYAIDSEHMIDHK
ncbi:MAG: hypothetical protein BGO41_00730 [Clostridiales bacterium 38-18]|nr:MAG: hypothetical protein BGO41_00730 [Clostridiales bacterium 38-18]